MKPRPGTTNARLPLPRLLPHCLAIALAVGPNAFMAAERQQAADLSGTMFARPTPLRQTAEQGRQSAAAWMRRAERAPPAVPVGSTAVTNCDDSGPGSFRQAVVDAISGDTIDLTNTGCSTITLSSGDVVTNVDDLTLQGPGASQLTITGNDLYRPIQHTGTGTLTINDVTLAHGLAYLPVGQVGNAGGGCVFSSGSVSIAGSVVDQCLATNFTSGTTVRGGAICGLADVEVTASVVSGSMANSGHGYAYGGGIYAGGHLTIVNSHVTQNQATPSFYAYGGGAQAGGLANTADSVSIESSLIDYNSASNGGGLYVSVSNDILIDSSTIANNSADNTGGAQLFSTFSTAQIQNSTVTRNDAGQWAGLNIGFAKISNSTIAFNTSHGPTNYSGAGVFVSGSLNVELESTILAGNTTDRGSGPEPDDIGSNAAGLLSGANNLIYASSLSVPVDTIVQQDPLLQPLGDNGGPTPTMALGAGSPAIDTGNNVDDFVNDQRGSGFARVFGSAPDIGAVEYGSTDVIFANGFDAAQ